MNRAACDPARAPRHLVLGLALLVSVACAGSEEPGDVPASEVPPAPAVDHAALADAAVGSADRPENDLEDDAQRKPADVLAFFQIEPGMRVLDLLAGSGYYTELLSRVVGDGGSVICHNNAPYLAFMGDSYGERFAGERLPNVRRLDAEVNTLDLAPGSLDAVIFVLGYHDTYFEPGDGSWPEIDHTQLLAKLHEALVPGGVLGIVDHAAAPNEDTVGVATGLHRIDEEVVKRDVTEAGFVLDAEASFLRNPEDDHSIQVFDPAIRRKTDRFVLRFRRPEA